jgi:Flp pilus assembly protein TadB
MGRSPGWLSRAIALAWLALVIVCLLAGWVVAALVVLLLPALIGLVSLLAVAVYWHRHPQHRRIGAWFNEATHIRHW